jgi:aspartate aminotransferase-like enzyme
MEKQCARWGIEFDLLSMEWGTSFTIEIIEEFIRESKPEWLLFCACESSSGARIELEKIYQLADIYHFRVCVDIMTAIGNYPLDLSKASLATASSGKGLASLSGLCLIFSDHIPEPDQQIPTYLDLGFYFEKDGMPYTLSSNHLISLLVASQIMLTQEHYEKICYQSQWLTDEIQKLKTGLLLNDVFPYTSHLQTWQMPDSICSVEFGKQLEKEGVLTSYQSLYQVKANVIQFALMSDHTEEEMNQVMKCIRNALSNFG